MNNVIGRWIIIVGILFSIVLMTDYFIKWCSATGISKNIEILTCLKTKKNEVRPI